MSEMLRRYREHRSLERLSHNSAVNRLALELRVDAATVNRIIGRAERKLAEAR